MPSEFILSESYLLVFICLFFLIFSAKRVERSPLERYLGAKAVSKPKQDYTEISVKMKTIPVDSDAQPLDNTFVCVTPLIKNHGVIWKISYVSYNLRASALTGPQT
ncbi:MutH/Sau3AI family endonuclease [secondary endosymbiont of Ctenarytaina eucalypti]|uniref:DNA mismatch repair protein n=1 Tax=secondary endosymbiont of Ctenarytaina eucalypti TaxID=1199245 RepID=J3YR30_9ENTR|nr:MutH/Sau3AI family endonuclease [secondary endosymbiont of Ctenarytaina eucalypti]AFP84443.1 DNA mismatch repair protein [secondary endosymbiont of Ctenarytaina eucalypti]